MKDTEQRLWYAAQTVSHGWSRAILEHQIESDLYGRQGKALTNFSQTLPPPQSDLAQQILKDPYNFDVRHDTRCGLPDSFRGLLGRMYPSQPTDL